MRARTAVGWTTLLATVLPFKTSAVPPTRHEFGLRHAWLQEHVATNAAAWPFSFVQKQRSSAEFLRMWKREHTSTTAKLGRVDHTVTLAEPATGLVVRCDITELWNHPALEWLLYFENRGAQDTPLLEAIRPLDVSLPSTTNETALHYARGAVCSFDDFQPLAETLKPGKSIQFQAGGGRSSSDFLPFFNVKMASDGLVLGEPAGGNGDDLQKGREHCSVAVRRRLV